MKFTDLALSKQLQQALKAQKYENPTEIQEQTIPHALEGKDILGIAQTGTGKTAAFSLPVLQHIQKRKKHLKPYDVRVLILAPTRELAAQIDVSLAKYGKNIHYRKAVVFGGVKQHRQVQVLKKGVDILVATPGRLFDLAEQGYVSLENIEFFIVDEVDRMLDMGFIVDIRKVLEIIPKKRQTLFFSATLSKEVEKLARGMLTNPIHVETTPEATTVDKIDQRILFVDRKNKDDLLLQLVEEEEQLDRMIIFTATKHRADKIARMLKREGTRAEAIHGDKSQAARTRALKNFKTGRVHILVATDIAARGIHVDRISHVVNYDLPNDPENYVHRIGRTARAGEEGTAYSFCTADDKALLQAVEKTIKMEIPNMLHDLHSEKARNAEAKKRRGRYGRRTDAEKRKTSFKTKDRRRSKRQSTSRNRRSTERKKKDEKPPAKKAYKKPSRKKTTKRSGPPRKMARKKTPKQKSERSQERTQKERKPKKKRVHKKRSYGQQRRKKRRY